MYIVKAALLRFLIILGLVASVCCAQAKSLQVGHLAPDIESCEFSLKAEKGKFVVLYFYPKDHTANCTIQATQFAAKFAEFEKLNAVIVGVSADSHASHVSFKRTHKIPFNLMGFFIL